jgi:DNA-binding transcriptional ArsR family regulator
VSQHLRVLRGAGLLVERREGTRRFYRARPDALAELRAFVEAFWEARLADIQTIAEKGP